MSKPSARELVDDTQKAIDRIRGGLSPMRVPAERDDADLVLYDLAARVERVLALHKPFDVTDAGLIPDGQYCDECGVGWPCPTMRLLNGEER